jgi:hypothetical protein
LGKVETNLETAAAKAGMDAKTARKYRRLGRVPSELTPGPRWRTREDSFQEVWEEVRSLLEVNPGLEAKTIFEYLQRRDAGRFADGQLRTLQRRVKVWRATEGPWRPRPATNCTWSLPGQRRSLKPKKFGGSEYGPDQSHSESDASHCCGRRSLWTTDG